MISVTTMPAKLVKVFSELKVEDAFTNSRINRVIKLNHSRKVIGHRTTAEEHSL